MSEAEVRPTHQQWRAPLPAAGAKVRGAAWLAALLLLAAGCSMAGDPIDMRGWTFVASNGGRGPGPGPVTGVAGMGAGVGVPGASGTGTPVGAGTGQPIPTAGVAGSVVVPPAAGGVSGGPPVVTAGTGGTRPNPDGGLPPFNAGTDPARNRVSVGQICARASAIQCAAEVHCCTAPKQSLEACKTQLTKSCNDGLYLDQIAMNDAAAYSSAQAEVVFNKIEELAQACDPEIALWIAKPEGLASMFQGTVPPNGTCKPMGLPGPRTFGGALASCTGSATTACLFTGNAAPPTQPQTATCAPRGDAGAPCFLAPNCKDGLFCPNPQNTYSGGKCTPLKPLGQTCTGDGECATFTCRGAICVGPSSQTAYCVSN